LKRTHETLEEVVGNIKEGEILGEKKNAHLEKRR
jgi:hypothetical protein